MSRLTFKREEIIEGWHYGSGNVKKMTNKLGQLEDIEEELDIDLIVLIKAQIDGIYYVNDDGDIEDDVIKGIVKDSVGWGFVTYWSEIELLFSDYGRTWALTKEELER